MKPAGRNNPILYYTYLFMTALLIGYSPSSSPYVPVGLPLAEGTDAKRREENNVAEFKRFNIYHRIVHLVMAVSFLGLVASGMPINTPRPPGPRG